jgi:hypothetical protein
MGIYLYMMPPSYSKYIGQIYTDSLVHNEDALKFLVSQIGQNKVILGSDYPFPLGEHHPGKLIQSVEDWSDELKDKVLAGNAFEFLGVDRSFYEIEPSVAPPQEKEVAADAKEEEEEEGEPPAKLAKVVA